MDNNIDSDVTSEDSSSNSDDSERCRKRQRVQDYVEKTVASYSAEEFRRNFRLKKDTFRQLLGN